MIRALVLTAAATVLTASSAHAQIAPLPAGPSMADQQRWQVEQHRYEMDRLRLQSDQREAATRQLQLETRQNRMRLEQQRTTDPYVPTPPRALRSPEEERAARVSATQRRETTSSRVGEIDAWLDRAPN